MTFYTYFDCWGMFDKSSRYTVFCFKLFLKNSTFQSFSRKNLRQRILSSGGHFVPWSRNICAILVLNFCEIISNSGDVV